MIGKVLNNKMEMLKGKEIQETSKHLSVFRKKSIAN